MQYPMYDCDLFADDAVSNPYPHYAALRKLGPVVLLPSLDMFAVSRYADVKTVLLNHRGFSSAEGVGFNDVANEASKGSSLSSDEPLHSVLRSISAAPLQPNAVQELRDEIAATADALIAGLVQRGHFDGVTDLAHHLPVTIVSNLVGLPEEGRASMLEWAAAAFDSFGPPGPRFQDAFARVRELLTYVIEKAGPHQVKAGSWAARVYEAADEGLISPKQAAGLLLDYLGPSLDTTIFATGHMLNLLATHQDQWHYLKADPSLVPNAIDEILRLETPIRTFTRLAIADADIGGVIVPAGSRVAIFYASANRDEAHWPDADRFDVTRSNAKEHLAFGKGRHVCAGQHLAKLEMTCLLQSMIRHIDRFTVSEPVIACNSLLRGYSSLPMKVIAASGQLTV